MVAAFLIDKGPVVPDTLCSIFISGTPSGGTTTGSASAFAVNPIVPSGVTLRTSFDISSSVLSAKAVVAQAKMIDVNAGVIANPTNLIYLNPTFFIFFAFKTKN